MVHRTTVSIRRTRKTVSRKPQTSSILHARHSNIFPPSGRPTKAGLTRKGRKHPRRSTWYVAATHNGRRHRIVAMSARTAAIKYLHGKPWYIAWVFRAPEGKRYEAIVKGEHIMRRGVVTPLYKHQLLGTNDQPPSASDVRQYEAMGTRSTMVKRRRSTLSGRRSTLSTRSRHSSSSRSSGRSSHSSSSSHHRSSSLKRRSSSRHRSGVAKKATATTVRRRRRVL